MNIRKALIYDSMNQLYILSLALWSAFNSSDAWDPYKHTTEVPWPVSVNVPQPSITVYRQMEDREHVIVLCKGDKMFEMAHRRLHIFSFELSVESELNYTVEQQEFSPFSSSEMSMFLVTVNPPASFKCVQIYFVYLDDTVIKNLSSQTYNYSGSVSDHHEEGVSLLYICFSSFIAVSLFIMTAAVIVTNIRSKTKDTNSTAVTDNDYVEA